MQSQVLPVNFGMFERNSPGLAVWCRTDAPLPVAL